ncbi:MAG: hypothetical protein AB9M60_03235 [Leptothrix sp. (in: b-proteobacteria)]
MASPLLTRPARAVLTLLLVGLAHAALLGSAGRTSDLRGAGGTPSAAATERLAPAPIRVRMLPLPALATVAATAATAAAPARPHGVASRRSNTLHTEPAPGPAPTSLEPPEAPPTNAPATPETRYLPSAELDRAALPRSAPDTRLLDNVMLSGLPLRLRICIDAFGHVTQVLPLQAHPDDAAAVTALQEMFGSTAYVPGRLGGIDVASYIDLDISVGPLPDS